MFQIIGKEKIYEVCNSILFSRNNYLNINKIIGIVCLSLIQNDSYLLKYFSYYYYSFIIELKLNTLDEVN